MTIVSLTVRTQIKYTHATLRAGQLITSQTRLQLTRSKSASDVWLKCGRSQRKYLPTFEWELPGHSSLSDVTHQECTKTKDTLMSAIVLLLLCQIIRCGWWVKANRGRENELKPAVRQNFSEYFCNKNWTRLWLRLWLLYTVCRLLARKQSSSVVIVRLWFAIAKS